MEPILVSIVPPERFSKTCCLCELNGRASKAAAGACMSCNKPGCRLSFHVTCAQVRGLLCEEPLHSMNNVTYCGYCPHHYAKLKRGHNLKAIPAFKPSQEPAGGGAGDAPALKPALPPPPPADASRAERKTKKPKLSRSPRAQATAELAPPSTHNDSSSSSCLSLASDVAPSGAAEERRDRPPAVTEPAAGDGSGDREPDPATPTAGNGSAGDTKFTTANFTETVVTVTGSVFGAAARTGGSEPVVATSGPGTESESTLSAASDLDNKEATLVIKQEVCEPELPPPVPPPPVKPPSPPPRSLPPPQPQPAVASVITSLPAAASSLPLSISPVVSLSQVSPHLVASKTKRPLSTTPSDKEHRKRKPPGRPRKHPAPPLPSVSAAVPLPISAPSPVSLVPSPVPSGTSALPPTSASSSSASTPTPTSSASSSSSASGAALSVVVVEREPAELSPQAVPRKRSSGELASPLCGGAGASALNGRSGASALAAAARTNGLPAAAHMLGNQLNPGSRLADSLAAEMAEQAAFTPPAPRLCGPQLPVRHTPAPAAHRQTGGSAAAPFPQSLSELLERQWEQGSHFLMEQSQHFDVAALLSCLYQLRQENHQLEEHMSELASRRDHLMVVNARLSLPLENAAPVPAAAAAARSQPSQRHSSGASLTSSASLHGPVLENGTGEPPLQPTPPSPLPHAAVIHSPVGRPSAGASPLGARPVPGGGRLPPSVSPQMGAVSRHSPTVRQGSSVPYMMSAGVGGGAPLLMSAGTVAHQQHPQLHQQHPQLQQASPAGRPMQPPGAAGRPPTAHERDRDQRIMESLRVSAAAASAAAGGYPHYQLVSPPGSGAHQPPPMHHMVHMPPPASHGPPPPGHGPPGRPRPSDKR